MNFSFTSMKHCFPQAIFRRIESTAMVYLKKLLVPGMVGIMFLLSGMAAVPLAYAGVPYAGGDVFAGVGNGNVSQFSPTGTLKNTLATTSPSLEETGMCFDSSGDLFVTNFEAGTMSKFDSSGNLIAADWYTFPGSPESCVLNNSGDIFVGGGGLSKIYEFSDSGTSGTLLNSWSVNTGPRGSDWIDLAADQCTMEYTSEGDTIFQFNVCTGTQLADFVTGLPASPCYANRIIPSSGGEVLVACSSKVLLLSSTGTVIQTYSIPSESSFLFALNLDPDGTSFWTAGYASGNIYRIDIASGTVLTTFNAPHAFSVAGLAIFAEPVVGCPSCTTTTSSTVGVPQFGAGPNPTLLLSVMAFLGVVVLFRLRRGPVQRPVV